MLPGDLVVGDRDGVVVISQEDLSRVIIELKEVRQIEAAMEAKVKGGLKANESIRKLLDSDKVRIVD